MKEVLLIVLFTVLLAAPTAASAIDFDSCFHVVPEGEVAVVRSDLDCSALTGVVSFVLEDGARLELDGHSLLGNPDSGAVVCRGKCTIAGPGAISGYGRAIYGERGSMGVSDLLLTDNEESIDVVGSLTLARVNAASTRYGIRASKKLTLSDVEVSNSGGNGVMARRIVGTDVTISGCHTAVTANGGIRLERLTATGCVTGVVARSARLSDSVLSSHGTDLLTIAEPTLDRTSCHRSARRLKVPGGFQTGPAWGVCSGD